MDLKLPLRAAAIALACAFVSSCAGGDGDKPAPSAAPAKDATTKVAAKPAEPAKTPDAKPAAAGDSPAPPVAEKAGAHSAVPTVDEWNAVTGEITVRGSSALGCETKGLREWVRISCRGTDPGRGSPTQVTVENAKGAETFKFASGGVTSLVYRFEEGTKVEATFKWDRASKKLVAEWPPGAPMPTAYGAFGG